MSSTIPQEFSHLYLLRLVIKTGVTPPVLIIYPLIITSSFPCGISAAVILQPHAEAIIHCSYHVYTVSQPPHLLNLPFTGNAVVIKITMFHDFCILIGRGETQRQIHE